MIEITDKALQTAAAKGMDEFLRVFTDKYKETVGGDPTAETMPLLSGEQHSLLAYRIFRDEVTEGGFCQLIQNGFLSLGLAKADAGTATSICLIFLSALLTGLNLYNSIARFAGAGTLVPITGFANSVVSPAIDFKSED